MRFSSRRAVLAFAPMMFVLMAVGGAGCENKHIGRPCNLEVPPNAMGDETSSLINDQALECPTRICLLPAATKGSMGTQPYCTSDCSSDDDCSDGETRSKGNADDKRCVTGYTCGVAATVGPFCCRKMCICKDFVEVPVKTPPVCEPGKSTCQNVK